MLGSRHAHQSTLLGPSRCPCRHRPARDRLSRALESEKLARTANAEAAEKLEGAVAALRDARLAILALARDVGGSDVADNFAYLTDAQAAALAKVGGLAALLAKA